ncbi:MAG TPA: class I SAM-dependent methyltransferase, partial [Firmicutes bacterium]|nr:class I SAM-dependent methyltransferase [Bacillota bacterium]
METIKSKGWNWDKSDEIFWRTPAEESYYLRLRWEKLDFEEFLDLGCGVGRHSLFFAEDGYTVTSFDISNSGLNELREKADSMGLEMDLHHGDMLNLPYQSQSFDCILAYHSIYHTNYVNLKSIFSKLYDLLVDGGELYVTLNSKATPAFTDLRNNKVDEHTIIKTEGIEAGILHTYVSEEEISELIQCFKLVSMKHIGS